MSSEYNIQYLNLKKRLDLLNLKNICAKQSSNTEKKRIDSLGKELDFRYLEEKQLDTLEEKIESIESLFFVLN